MPFTNSESSILPSAHHLALFFTQFGIDMLLFEIAVSEESELIMLVSTRLFEDSTITGLPRRLAMPTKCSLRRIPVCVSYCTLREPLALVWIVTKAVLLKPLNSTSCVETEVLVLLYSIGVGSMARNGAVVLFCCTRTKPVFKFRIRVLFSVLFWSILYCSITLMLSLSIMSPKW